MTFEKLKEILQRSEGTEVEFKTSRLQEGVIEDHVQNIVTKGIGAMMEELNFTSK